MGYSYSLKDGVVTIVEDDNPGKPITINKRGILVAIETTKRFRDIFATQETYQKELDKYQGALKYWEMNHPSEYEGK